MPITLPYKMEFHISKSARDYYKFDQQLFSLTGNVLFADFHAARLFAQKMNARRDLLRFPDQSVDAGQINAMGLIDEILHLVIKHYRELRNPKVMAKALTWLENQVGEREVEDTLSKFAHQFPPLSVYLGELTVDEYMSAYSTLADGSRVNNRQLLLEELIMLWLANMNPAFTPFLELFDDIELEERSAYTPIMGSL
jgi:prepilin-type processing-associated H-X9-DG protein